MPFPVSPNPGDSYTDAYGTVWIYAGSVNGWYRQEVVPGNETTYTGGGSGSATATGTAGEIQFTDGTNLAASPNLLWDDANDELEVTGDLKLLDGGSFTTTLQTITPTANRTVSIPDATGTLALVAGSSGQLLYNNAGANAGVSTFTADSSGRLTNSASSASGFPVKLWNGTIFAGTTPHVLVQPTGASTPTSTNAWSANGTALAVNTAAGFTGNLLDLQVNGTRQARITNTGDIWFGNTATGYFSAGASVLYLGPSGTAGVSSGGVVRAGAGIAFVNGNVSGTGDVFLGRSAAGVIRVTDASANDATLNAQLRAAGTAPASGTATGTAGDIRYDADYIYVCTATNTWKRAALAPW